VIIIIVIFNRIGYLKNSLSGFRRFRQAGEKADTFGGHPKNKGELIKRNSPFNKFAPKI